MKKILTLIAIASFSSLFSQITINTNFPSMMDVGSSVELDVKINKGALVSFAKYHIDVPVGYSIYLIDAKGGSFTFENQRGKIVWVSVPSDPEFSVKLKLQANENAVSPGTFAQKFYYIVDNEKKEVSASPAVITIGKPNPSDIAASNPTDTKTNTEPTKTQETLTSSNTDNKSAENTTNKNEKPTTDVVASSNSTDSKNTTAQSSNSNNQSTSADSKTVSSSKSSESNVAATETPKTEGKSATSAVKTDETAKANNNLTSTTKQSDSKTTDSKNASQATASNTSNTNSESKPSGNSKPAATKNTDSKTTTSNETKVADNSVAGMTFKVQIGAYSSQPAKSLFTKAGKVNIDLIEGMYKVTTGNFNTLEDALKYRDELQTKGFNDSFIAKYKNGSRIN